MDIFLNKYKTSRGRDSQNLADKNVNYLLQANYIFLIVMEQSLKLFFYNKRLEFTTKVKIGLKK